LNRNLDQHVCQYITDYKGKEDIEDKGKEAKADNHDIDTFIMDYEYGNKETEQFFTTTVNTLSDQSLSHVLIKSLPLDNSIVLKDPFVYISDSRYTSDRFYGIIVDTRASNISTAGWGQFLVY
jgi:hypothetical protein